MVSLRNSVGIDGDGNIFNNKWIEWSHFLIPNKQYLLRELIRKIMASRGHCLTCTILDGCYFLEDKKPEIPLHLNCDCRNINIDYRKVQKNASAEISILKLTNYVFAGKQKSRGKEEIFKSFGYGIQDVFELKEEYQNQARENYIKGNYKLNKLDIYGQRITIPITLNGKRFYSGWMIYPEGKIRNITPFGGWIK